MTRDRPRFAHLPARGERRPDDEPTRHAKRLAARHARSVEVAQAVQNRRLSAVQESSGPEERPLPEGPYMAPVGRRNGGRPSARFTPPPSVHVRPLDVVWLSFVFPDCMTTRRERSALKEL